MISRNPSIFALALGLFILPTICVGSSSVDMTVVAEHTAIGKKLQLPALELPSYYLAFDAGYLEEGTPIAGIKPPVPAAVGQALHTALSAGGYQVATAKNAPSLVLVYTYGIIRPDPYNDASSSRTFLRITSNLRARLNLVAGNETALRAQNQIVYGSLIPIVPPSTQDALDMSQSPRIFIIVSAYDYNDCTRQKPSLLWRVRLSALENSGDMADVVPALAGAIGPYLGRNYRNRQSSSASLLTTRQPESSSSAEPVRFPLPQDAVEKIDPVFLRNLMLQERATSAGQLPNEGQPTSTSVLPPDLAQRITAYQQEKIALQGALQTKLNPLPPGPDTNRAIDQFKGENADRIRRLEQNREDIRSELSRLAASGAAANDKSLDTLLHEFAVGIQRVATQSTKTNQ